MVEADGRKEFKTEDTFDETTLQMITGKQQTN